MSHFGKSGPPDIRDTFSLLVLNISFRTTADDLFPLFDKYGKVVDVFIPKDRRTGDSRGFAFVRYKYQDEAAKAVEKLDGRVVDGREIMVRFAKYGPNAEKIDKGRVEEPASRSRGRSRSRSPRPRDKDHRRGSDSRSRAKSEREHLVIGTEIADIEAEVGLVAEAVVEVLVIVGNVEEANTVMMRDVDEVGLMEVLLLSREAPVLGGAPLQTKHLLLGTEVLLKINT